MPVNPSDIETILRDAFPGADVTVQGDDGVHLAAEVIAPQFKGKPRVAQQRLVYAALGDLMEGSNGALHALALTTRAKD